LLHPQEEDWLPPLELPHGGLLWMCIAHVNSNAQPLASVASSRNEYTSPGLASSGIGQLTVAQMVSALTLRVASAPSVGTSDHCNGATGEHSSGTATVVE
jgi:hypothetical protein